jgi:hypothetical protein
MPWCFGSFDEQDVNQDDQVSGRLDLLCGRRDQAICEDLTVVKAINQILYHSTMRKKKIQYEGGHYSRGQYNKEQLSSAATGTQGSYRSVHDCDIKMVPLRCCRSAEDYGGLDRHALYESAVQSPKGDISYLLCFYRKYIGVQVFPVNKCGLFQETMHILSYISALELTQQSLSCTRLGT